MRVINSHSILCFSTIEWVMFMCRHYIIRCHTGAWHNRLRAFCWPVIFVKTRRYKIKTFRQEQKGSRLKTLIVQAAGTYAFISRCMTIIIQAPVVPISVARYCHIARVLANYKCKSRCFVVIHKKKKKKKSNLLFLSPKTNPKKIKKIFKPANVSLSFITFLFFSFFFFFFFNNFFIIIYTNNVSLNCP